MITPDPQNGASSAGKRAGASGSPGCWVIVRKRVQELEQEPPPV
ncbi:MAG: hypothetical protein AAF462_11950 [Thermodesulfobacteriota bacterium]